MKTKVQHTPEPWPAFEPIADRDKDWMYYTPGDVPPLSQPSGCAAE